jgi:hypothetical protein
MYTCERCGTSFGRPSAVLESCPRCLARDGVRVPLAFRLFEDAGSGGRTPGGLEAAVRARLACTVPRRFIRQWEDPTMYGTWRSW